MLSPRRRTSQRVLLRNAWPFGSARHGGTPRSLQDTPGLRRQLCLTEASALRCDFRDALRELPSELVSQLRRRHRTKLPGSSPRASSARGFLRAFPLLYLQLCRPCRPQAMAAVRPRQGDSSSKLLAHNARGLHPASQARLHRVRGPVPRSSPRRGDSSLKLLARKTWGRHPASDVQPTARLHLVHGPVPRTSRTPPPRWLLTRSSRSGCPLDEWLLARGECAALVDARRAGSARPW